MTDPSDGSEAALVAETADRLFAAHAEAAFEALPPEIETRAIPWSPTLWDEIEEMGFPLALLDEEAGGFGLDAPTALGLVRQAAAQALSLPLGETMIANWLLARAGLEPVAGPAAFVTGPSLSATGDGWRLSGTAAGVPWGRVLSALVVVTPAGEIARVEGGWSVTEGQNLAGEPRNSLNLDLVLAGDAVATGAPSPALLEALGAMLRAQSMAGALEAALNRTVTYVSERIQFGKPLAKLQVLQQNLAVVAGHTAAARAGADMVAGAFAGIETDPAALVRAAAAAKLRAGEAATISAPIVHQTHGAIGFTREYALHPLTTRLWAWRDEYGAEPHWADLLGAEALAQGGAGYWAYLSGTGAAPQEGAAQ